MESIKVEGRLVNDSGDSRLRHKNRILPIIMVILFSVGYIFGSRWYISYQLNSEKFSNAHATIEQLSEQYGYEGEHSLTLEERIKAGKDGTEGRRNKIYYLDRQAFSKEDYVKYTEVRDYYADILATPYMSTLLGTVLITSSLMYILYKLFTS